MMIVAIARASASRRASEPDGRCGASSSANRDTVAAKTPICAVWPIHRAPTPYYALVMPIDEGYPADMRVESSVTSLSWIPSEAITGLPEAPFKLGMAHFDPPPPDELSSLEELKQQDRFRFANELRAYIETDGKRITDYGYTGCGHINATKVGLGKVGLTFEPFALPDDQSEPEVGDGWVRFTQSGGGRTGMAAPQKVNERAPFRWHAPLCWTTLALTIYVDGSSEFEMLDASPFPRHWVYDEKRRLAQKTGLMDFNEWYRRAFNPSTPWGQEDSSALVTEVESALERQLSTRLMHGRARPRIHTLRQGQLLTRQGELGRELFLLLDGVVSVDVDGNELAQLGPGVVLGERALLEQGVRTATITALTRCRVAEAPAGEVDIDLTDLQKLQSAHRREDAWPETQSHGKPYI